MSDWQLSQAWDTGDGVVRWDAFGSGPPLVLLHGTPFSSYIWRDIAPVLAKNHRVYVWDMLGFGASEAHSEDLSLTRQAHIFADLLHLWNLKNPKVIAHDVGGVVALQVAVLGRVSFESLTLINAASVPGWGSAGFFQAVHQHPEAFELLPAWALDTLIEAKLRSGSHGGLRPRALDRYMTQWKRQHGRSAFIRQYAQGGEEHSASFQDGLAHLDFPLRVIWGAEDEWMNLDYARKLVQSLPAHTELSIIAGAGHAVPEDQPGALLAVLGA
ncbi:pimeloyl-ACP methyl ester carboxylesterase [Leucobacter luti]|uniref:alpha/beta fold hydrolase n=1 Tax=Leucobacter luti TaxID=340320 RepID=UPI00104B337E|nr:alpha/beta hydrolase [Leucobacter luti]MCW2287857.1 pimeloyl-ACP methyl ester carboxylesterase [Leucobacter luti]TCK45980.1 pimeloyl-ACP methyl ester carboxylesterase [Leucobacter luti]